MTTTNTHMRHRKKEEQPVPAGLPPALHPWARAFSSMPEPHLRVIGWLMEALAPLIESEESALRSGFAEIDSFDDVAAAGPLDRLLTSELVWLKLMRGEFVRRIAEGEALRRRPLYRDPADDRAVIVLLDNGPFMIGRRRLVALAALLTLGAATLRRGDRFLWAATGHVGPSWQEGISRRSLSQFINQTGAEELSAGTLEALLGNAPVDTTGNNAILWSIAPKNSDFGGWVPSYRFEIDEFWPDLSNSDDETDHAYYAGVAVVSDRGVRRTARFAFPDEQSCADTLRTPFRARSEIGSIVGGTNWAPDWISREADDGASILRDGDGIVFYRRYFAPLRIDLANDDELLGARWPGNGPCAIALRQGAEIHAIRFSPDGHVFERGSTALAGDHPLLAEAHPSSAVPPLLRLGRKAAFTVGAPNGQLYAISFLSDAAHSALSVSLADQTKNLRLMARSRTWLLCDTERGGQRAFVLIHARNGRRVFLRRDEALVQCRHIAHCEMIGETGGALLHIDGGWRWISPAWWSESEETVQPQIAADAILLRVDPMQHARNAVLASHRDTHPMNARRWSALFWSLERGLEEWSFANGDWSWHRRQAPNLDGRVTAMVLIGKEVLARVIDDDDTVHLLQFRLGAATTPTVQSGPRWWGDAICVDY